MIARPQSSGEPIPFDTVAQLIDRAVLEFPDRRSAHTRLMHRLCARFIAPGARRHLLLVLAVACALMATRAAIPVAVVYLTEPIDHAVVLPESPRVVGLLVDGRHANLPGSGRLMYVTVRTTAPPRYRWWLLRHQPWVGRPVTATHSNDPATSVNAEPRGVAPDATPAPDPTAAAARMRASRTDALAAAQTQARRDGHTLPPAELRPVLDPRVQGGSAGLALALAMYSWLSGEDLTRGRDVVVTGSINASGQVEPIGHALQKGKAAAEMHADLLLVPTHNRVQAARFSDDVQVIAVDTLAEALRALRAGTLDKSA